MSNANWPTGALSWSFFRRSEEPDLCCAVPVTRSVPRFLMSGQWNFSGQVPDERAPSGFRLAAALESEHLNGFYLFQLVAGSDNAA